MSNYHHYHHHHHHTKHNTGDKIQEAVLTFAGGSAGAQTASTLVSLYAPYDMSLPAYYLLQGGASIGGATLGSSVGRKLHKASKKTEKKVKRFCKKTSRNISKFCRTIF